MKKTSERRRPPASLRFRLLEDEAESIRGREEGLQASRRFRRRRVRKSSRDPKKVNTRCHRSTPFRRRFRIASSSTWAREYANAYRRTPTRRLAVIGSGHATYRPSGRTFTMQYECRPNHRARPARSTCTRRSYLCSVSTDRRCKRSDRRLTDPSDMRLTNSAHELA